MPVALPAGEEEVSALMAFWYQVPSWLVSTVLHLACILMLAMYTVADIPQLHVGIGATLIGAEGDGDGLDDSSLDTGEENAAGAAEKIDDVLKPTSTTSPGNPSLETSTALLPSAPSIDSPLGAMHVPAGPGGATGGEGQLLAGLGESIANSLQGRLSATNRARLVGSGGGTLASEDAVGRGLKWLSEHQNTDGSWTYQHQTAPHCLGRCDHPGNLNQAQVAATAMALLPFLGAGETQLQGRYKRNVDMGLHFLGRAMHQLHGNNGGLWQPGGRMYGHGLASIALCEAFGMTRDNALQSAAQKSLDFIVAAQDPIGGGWRYSMQEPGDTSVVGWQLMALKSGTMAYLKVPTETIRKADYFLDSVQTENGAMYGYKAPGATPATSAIGLLCRMYLGWQRDKPELVMGIKILSEAGPSLDDSGPPRNNMYYNYYATQVLHHYGGYEWVKWNGVMRDYLVAHQETTGHAAGSWFFDGTDMGFAAGGRLYCTAMATMILEVYYRHLPLYGEASVKDQFR
jgi:hypothetical protein